MSPASFPHWSPPEPENSYLLAALEAVGIESDFVIAQPDGTWEVEADDGILVISFSYYYEGESPVWDVTRQSDGQVIASGELATVASAVAEVL